MIIDLLNQENPSKALDNNQSSLENMYLESDNQKGKYKTIAYSVPGLTTFCDTTQSTVRALYEHAEVLYAVASNKLYSINSSGVKTELLTLNTSTGFAKIEAITGASDTNNQLLIIDGTNGYQYNIGTSSAQAPISDGDFPQTAQDLTAYDDYFVVMKSNSISFASSDVSDGRAWGALDFASKTGKADRLNGINTNHGELWLLGSKTIELYTDTGNASFQFEKRTDVFIEYGCAAKRAYVVADNTLFVFSKSLTGGYSFVRFDGYTPKIIATPAILYQLRQLTTVSDCICYAYQLNGHECIDWTFPTDQITFSYDISNGTWFKKTSYVSSAYTRFLGTSSSFCYGKTLFGDFNSGKIYYYNNSLYTENTAQIRRRFVSPFIYYEGNRIFIYDLKIDVQSTSLSNKTLTIEISNDSGSSWTTLETLTVPAAGGRLHIPAVGSADSWLFRLTTTDDYDLTLLGFCANIEIGQS